jgi:hypothetical protein
MSWTVQWRTKGELGDAVFVLDEKGLVREAIPADQPVLSRLLTEMGDLHTWRSDSLVEGDPSDAEAWGTLVLNRASSGEVLEVEPELFWHGIYSWFRSRGVDYDTPGLAERLLVEQYPKPRLSVLMDD